MAHQLRLSPWAGSSSARMHHVPMINRPCKSFALRASAASTQGSSSPATRAAPPPMLHLHVSSDTTVSIPFSANGGKALQSSLNGLIQTFVDKQKATRPQRWPLLEFRCKGQEGTATADIEFFEVMCNPNAHSSAFEAKAMITLRTTAGIKVNTEARVPSLQADVDAFVQSAQ